MTCKNCKSENVVKEGDKYICKDCGNEVEENKKSPLKEGLDFILPIVIAFIVAMLLKTFSSVSPAIKSGQSQNSNNFFPVHIPGFCKTK